MNTAKTNVPIALNNKCMTAVRLALVLAPSDAIIAVTHVPMLVPSITNKALPIGIMPAPDMVTSIAVIAADDWNSAVQTMPISIKTNGKLTFSNTPVSAALIAGDVLNVSLISPKPTNIRPSPDIAKPIFFTVAFLEIMPTATPINASTPMNPLKLNPDKATIIPVNVVPMFAPIIIAVA